MVSRGIPLAIFLPLRVEPPLLFSKQAMVAFYLLVVLLYLLLEFSFVNCIVDSIRSKKYMNI